MRRGRTAALAGFGPKVHRKHLAGIGSRWAWRQFFDQYRQVRCAAGRRRRRWLPHFMCDNGEEMRPSLERGCSAHLGTARSAPVHRDWPGRWAGFHRTMHSGGHQCTNSPRIGDNAAFVAGSGTEAMLCGEFTFTRRPQVGLVLLVGVECSELVPRPNLRFPQSLQPLVQRPPEPTRVQR